jgi:hypothetical protein
MAGRTQVHALMAALGTDPAPQWQQPARKRMDNPHGHPHWLKSNPRSIGRPGSVHHRPLRTASLGHHRSPTSAEDAAAIDNRYPSQPRSVSVVCLP